VCVCVVSADEKRRTVADFRESSFIQTKETLSVSVKAISALYLSKVAKKESTQSLSKPVNIPLLTLLSLFQITVNYVNTLGAAHHSQIIP